MRTLVLILCALLLAACQGLPAGEVPQPSATPQPSQTPTPLPTATATITPTPGWLVPESDLRGRSVTFWHPWVGAAASQVQDLAGEFTRDNPWGIRVEAVSYGGAYALHEAVLAAPGAGGLPAAVAAQPEQIAVWQAQSGLVADLNGYLSDPTWSSAAPVFPNFWQGGQVDGARISVPAERDTALLFYNQGWAQELGFAGPPATPEEFRQQACAAFTALLNDNTVENNGMGGMILNGEALTVLSWMYAFGAPEMQTAGADYRFEGEPTAAALAFVRALLDEGCAWRSRLPAPYEYFANRQALFYAGSLEDVEPQTLAQARLGKQDDWTVLPFPQGPGGSGPLSSGLNYAVFRAEPAEQLAAWAFIRWMMEPEQQSRLAAVNGRLALSKPAAERLAEYGRTHPQWLAAQALADSALDAPDQAAWRTVQHLLEDAAWMALQPNVKPEQIPEILTQLDGMVAEIIP